MTRLKVLIVDDEPPARERLRSLLAEIPDMEVVGEATNGPQSLERTHSLAPDVVLLDVRMPGMDGIEVARHLNDELRGLTLYCDGWANDYTWLATLYEAADLTPAFKLDNLRALLSEREAAHWHIVKQQVATEMRLQRHRASSDARLLQATLMRLRTPLPSGP